MFQDHCKTFEYDKFVGGFYCFLLGILFFFIWRIFLSSNWRLICWNLSFLLTIVWTFFWYFLTELIFSEIDPSIFEPYFLITSHQWQQHPSPYVTMSTLRLQFMTLLCPEIFVLWLWSHLEYPHRILVCLHLPFWLCVCFLPASSHLFYLSFKITQLPPVPISQLHIKYH